MKWARTFIRVILTFIVFDIAFGMTYYLLSEKSELHTGQEIAVAGCAGLIVFVAFMFIWFFDWHDGNWSRLSDD